jgi:hypothetical protein
VHQLFLQASLGMRARQLVTRLIHKRRSRPSPWRKAASKAGVVQAGARSALNATRPPRERPARRPCRGAARSHACRVASRERLGEHPIRRQIAKRRRRGLRLRRPDQRRAVATKCLASTGLRRPSCRALFRRWPGRLHEFNGRRCSRRCFALAKTCWTTPTPPRLGRGHGAPSRLHCHAPGGRVSRGSRDLPQTCSWRDPLGV